MTDNRRAVSIGRVAALVVTSAACVVLWLGLRGVATGQTTYRLTVLGELPPGRPVVIERWHEAVPWRGGLLPVVHEDTEHPAFLDDHIVQGVVASSHWGLFPRTLDMITIGFEAGGERRAIAISPFDGSVAPYPCEPVEGTDVARHWFRYDVRDVRDGSACLVHRREAREVEVTVDVRPATIVTLRTPPGANLPGDRDLVPAGEELAMPHAARRALAWGSMEDVYALDFEGFVVSQEAWARLRAPSLAPLTLTRAEWQQLLDAARRESGSWELSIAGEDVVLTAPAEPRSRAVVVVLGFDERDEIAIAHPRIVESTPAG